VDFVLEDARGRLVGIEVKKTDSPTSGDFKGLRHLSEQTGKKFQRGVLLHTGSTSVAFGPNLHAVPVAALWQFGSGGEGGVGILSCSPFGEPSTDSIFSP
jgi:uncharacterized protein